MNELQKLLTEYIEKERKLRKEAPFLSDYENGTIEGANDILDDVERIIQKVNVQ